MFLKILYFSFILSTSFSYAQTLHIEYGFNIFSLEIKENEIRYQKKNYSDKVEKKKCSEKLFKNFSDKITNITKKFPSDDKETGDFIVKYRYGNKTGKLNPASSFAKRLLSIPQEFDTFRLATEFRCEGQ